MKVQKSLKVNKTDKFIMVKKLCSLVDKKFALFKSSKPAKKFFLNMSKTDAVHMSLNSKSNYMLSTTRIHYTLLPLLTDYLFAGMENYKEEVALWLVDYLKNYVTTVDKKVTKWISQLCYYVECEEDEDVEYEVKEINMENIGQYYENKVDNNDEINTENTVEEKVKIFMISENKENTEKTNNNEKKSMRLNLKNNFLLNSGHCQFMVNNIKIDTNNNNYICVSDLCKIGGKRIDNYIVSTIVKKCLNALSIKLSIKESELLYSTGNRTYCHPRLLPCSSEWIFSGRNNHLDTNVKNECKQQITNWLVAQKLDTNVCANMKGTGMYKNGTEIMCSTEDGFVDATQACKLYGKIMYDYMKKVGTKKVLNEIAKDIGCNVESLMRKQDGHTLVHQRVMVNLAGYLSHVFAAEVTLWVIPEFGSNTIIEYEAKSQNGEKTKNKEKKNTVPNNYDNSSSCSGQCQFTVNNVKIDTNNNNYICVSKLCKIGGKRIDHYIASTIVKKCLSALSIKLSIKESELLYSTGNKTYCHPKLLPCSSEWIFSSRNKHLDTKVKNECKQQIISWLESQNLATELSTDLIGTGLYKGIEEIMCSKVDKFVDATHACGLYGKFIYNYTKNNSWDKTLIASAKRITLETGVKTLPESLHRVQDGHTFLHPRMMIMLAIWLSPDFGAKVASWVEAIMKNGYCVIEGEADTVKYITPPTEIPDIIDLTPYENKEVFYLASFTPVERVPTPLGLLDRSKLLSSGQKWLYKYGMTHNIQKRMSQHRNDKAWKNFRCLDVIISKGKSPLKMEKRIKVLVTNMNIQINIKSKIKYKTECFACTKEMYKKILSNIIAYNIIAYNIVKPTEITDIPCIDLVRSKVINADQYIKYISYVMELKKIEATSDASIELTKVTSDADHRHFQDEIELTKVKMEFLCLQKSYK